MRLYPLAALLLLMGSLRAADWPQFLGPTRNGQSTETGLLQTFPKKGPTILWSKDVGDGYSSPVVFGEQLFLFHRVGDKDVLDCFDASNGKSRWTFSYETSYKDSYGKGNGPRSTPLVSDKHVYILAADGRLHCVDRARGKEVWHKALHEDYPGPPARPRNFFGVGDSPILEGENLIVNVGGKGHGVVAFNKDTGKEVWKALDDDSSYASPVAATLGGKRQLVFFTRRGLALLNPADGSVLHEKVWRSRNPNSVNAATPLVVGDELFISSCYETGGTVLKVTKDKLESLWANDDSLSLHFSSPVYHDGHLYGFHGRQEETPELRCVEWKTGKVIWSREGFGCGSLLLADGQLIVMSERGDLVLVESTPKEFREKARASVLTGVVRAQMALANGKLYARDGKQLVCWDFKK
jgi:outer membrane protein assembly factor BamB